MTMDADLITDAAESAAKLAKVTLAPSDWRKLVLFTTAATLALLFVVYQLSGTVARAEITRLNTVDIAHAERLTTVETRVTALEALHTDMAVMKTNVEWIRQELEARKRAGYPSNESAPPK